MFKTIWRTRMRRAGFLAASLLILVFPFPGYADDPRPWLEGEWVLDDGSLRISIGKGGEIWYHPKFGRGAIRLGTDGSDVQIVYEEYKGQICSYKFTRKGEDTMWLGLFNPTQSPDFCPAGKFIRYANGERAAEKPKPQDEVIKLREQLARLEEALKAQQSKPNEEAAALKDELARLRQELKQRTAAAPAPVSGGQLGLVARTYQQPGINCAQTNEPIEELICADGELAEWDGMLAEAYRRLLDRSANKASIRQAQRDWIKLRSSVCHVPEKGRWPLSALAPAKPCIMRMVAERIKELESY